LGFPKGRRGGYPYNGGEWVGKTDTAPAVLATRVIKTVRDHGSEKKGGKKQCIGKNRDTKAEQQFSRTPRKKRGGAKTRFRENGGAWG